MATAPADASAELISRLRRAEGQLRGVQRMLDEGNAPRDVLIQLAAVKAAVDQVGLRLISSELRACVDGDGERCTDDLDDVLATFLRFGSISG